MSSSNVRVKKSSFQSESLRQLVRENSVTHKLVLSSCKSLAKEHMLLRYNFEDEIFEALALAPLLINGTLIR